MTRNQRIILFLMVIIVLCLCASVLSLIPSSLIPSSPAVTSPAQPATPTVPTGPTPPQHRAAGAIVQCRQFVRDRLVSPSSAKFSYEEAYKVNGEPLNYHAVTGIVESQNRMGVRLSSQYRCDTHYLPDQPGVWVLDYLKIED
jgi:hypothetical protein